MDQLVTIKKWSFFAFKNVLKYLFYSVFKHQPRFAKRMAPKNDNFSHFAKHRFIKKLCCNPPLDQTLGFFNLCVWNPKTLMLKKKHNLKSGKKTKIEKYISSLKQDRKHKKKKDWWKKLCNLILWIFISDVVPSRNQKKAKKKDKKEEMKEQERDRERELEKGGGQKRLWRNKGRHKKRKKAFL